MSDVSAIQRRWSTEYDRQASDYTDAGCRVLAEHAFADVAVLLAQVQRLTEARNEAVELLRGARPDSFDPALRRTWGRRRRAFIDAALTPQEGTSSRLEAISGTPFPVKEPE